MIPEGREEDEIEERGAEERKAKTAFHIRWALPDMQKKLLMRQASIVLQGNSVSYGA